MRLVSTPDNPIPMGAIVASARAVDGVRLRTARWVPPRAPRGTVAILGGRAEFIEKYFETIAQLLDRGFAVAAMDWRGQGGSARQLKNPRKGHVDDFSLYERDLDALVSEVLDPSCPRPWFGLGHSMGAAILLAVARAGRCPFDRLVLTSPMIALAGLQATARRAAAHRGSRRARPRRRFRAGRRLENRRLEALRRQCPHFGSRALRARREHRRKRNPNLVSAGRRSAGCTPLFASCASSRTGIFPGAR